MTGLSRVLVVVIQIQLAFFVFSMLVFKLHFQMSVAVTEES